uniref:tetratricopeptide repeat protein n=1 Tax=Streptomyces aureus TaxID=193461 RepID=UPI000B0CE7DB
LRWACAAPDDPAAAQAHLRTALDDHRAGGLLWPATEHQLLLAAALRSTGAHEEAAALLRAALASEVTGTPLRAADRARLCLALARTLAGSGGRGRTPRDMKEAAEGDGERLSLLAEAVRHTDGPAQDVRVGALARLLLGVAHAERGRYGKALVLLERALPGFAEDGDTTARVRVRAWLAECLLHLGEPGRAAREYALAAAEAGSWGEPRHGAALSRRTAHALGLAGSSGKARRASGREAWGGAVPPEETRHPVAARTHRPVPEVHGTSGTVDADAQAETEAEAEVGAPAGGAQGPWPGLRELPEPFGPPAHYQVDVYGEVGGAGPQGATAPGTRVQGCE